MRATESGQRRKVRLVAHLAQQGIRAPARRRCRSARREPLLQAVAELGGARQALPAVAGDRPLQQRAQAIVHLGRQGGRQREVLVGRAEDGAVRIALRRSAPGRRASRRASARRRRCPSAVQRLAARGLGRHVAGRADDGLCPAPPAMPPRGAVRAAMPKSITRARPVASTRMLDGFRSRCTTPAACAACSASRTPIIKVTDSRARRRGSPAQRLGQRAAVDVLEHEVGLVAVHVGLGTPARCSGGSGGSRCAPRAATASRRRFADFGAGPHQLDRDLAVQARVVAEPDRRLRALPEHAPQRESADRRRRGKGLLSSAVMSACGRGRFDARGRPRRARLGRAGDGPAARGEPGAGAFQVALRDAEARA